MRTLLPLSRRQAVAAALALNVVGHRALAQAANDPWPALAAQIFPNQTIDDGADALAIDAPYRAEDAAVVPVTLQNLLPDDDKRRIERITLIIDENPSPLAAEFLVGPNCGTRTISTRVRVDSYTNIHAVAALSDGSLAGIKRFVKAAGGCSAPAAKQEADSIPLGTMRFRQFPPSAGAVLRDAQLMIRHPNYSGMQMDQLTRLYVPALFVASVRIFQGDELLLGINSGISISENPEVRFDYRPNGAAEFRAEATDSEGRSFKASWSATRV